MIPVYPFPCNPESPEGCLQRTSAQAKEVISVLEPILGGLSEGLTSQEKLIAQVQRKCNGPVTKLLKEQGDTLDSLLGFLSSVLEGALSEQQVVLNHVPSVAFPPTVTYPVSTATTTPGSVVGPLLDTTPGGSVGNGPAEATPQPAVAVSPFGPVRTAGYPGTTPAKPVVGTSADVRNDGMPIPAAQPPLEGVPVVPTDVSPTSQPIAPQVAIPGTSAYPGDATTAPQPLPTASEPPGAVTLTGSPGIGRTVRVCVVGTLCGEDGVSVDGVSDEPPQASLPPVVESPLVFDDPDPDEFGEYE